MKEPAARGGRCSGLLRVLTATSKARYARRGSHRPVAGTLTSRLETGNGPVGPSLRAAGISVCRRKTPLRGLTRPRAAPEGRSLRDRGLDAAADLSNALARTHDADGVARAFLETVAELFGAGFAGLSLVSEDGRHAWGLLARFDGKDCDWWRDVKFD